jgi:hypothetical protein
VCRNLGLGNVGPAVAPLVVKDQANRVSVRGAKVVALRRPGRHRQTESVGEHDGHGCVCGSDLAHRQPSSVARLDHPRLKPFHVCPPEDLVLCT